MSNYTASSWESILKNMLNNIPDDYIKSAGTFVHDLTKTYALEGAKFEKKIQDIWKYFDIYNLVGEELEKRTFQLQGIKRKEATFAIGELTVLGNGNIIAGDLFETENGVQFKSLETIEIIERGDIKIQAVLSGNIGNVGANTITQIPITLKGINGCYNLKNTYDGFEQESDKSLIERYLIKVQTPATSGNIYHYMQWAREIAGVGESKIFPLWNGKNTVKVVIIDDLKKPASPELVKKVQNYIDPNESEKWGCGYGEAPIGAYCTVESAIGKIININVKISKESNYTLEEVKKNISDNLVIFLQNNAFKKNYISYALISNVVLETSGVMEWITLTVNNSTANISLADNEVAILGEINVYEQ